MTGSGIIPTTSYLATLRVLSGNPKLSKVKQVVQHFSLYLFALFNIKAFLEAKAKFKK